MGRCKSYRRRRRDFDFRPALDFFEPLDLRALFFALEALRDLLPPRRDFEPPRDLLERPPRLDPPRFAARREPRLFFALDLREPPDLRADRELLLRDLDFPELLDFFAAVDLRDEPRRDALAFLLDRPALLLRPDELLVPPREDFEAPPVPPPELWVIRWAATAPSTPPTTAPIGPATLPITAPVAAPAAGFGISMLSDEDDCEPWD